MTLKFSLPFIDQPKDFWTSLYDQFHQHIHEVYFPMNSALVASGRPVQTRKHLDSFLEFHELPKAVLINPVILAQPVEEIMDRIFEELIRLKQLFGVERVTVKDPILLSAIKKNLTGFRVTASVLMGIQHPEQLLYLENKADELVPDTSAVRNLPLLKQLRHSFTGSIKLLVNEGCLPGCLMRTQHFFEMGAPHCYPKSLCQTVLAQHPWLRLKSAWILPQHLYFYHGLYDIIKLSGRITLQDPRHYLRVFTAYLTGKALGPQAIGTGPAGVLQDIPITADFFAKTLYCEKKCLTCSICRNYDAQFR